MNKHLNYVIHQKQADLAYAKTALIQTLDNGNQAEKLHALDTVNTIRIELKAYQRLLNLISASQDQS